MFSGDLSMPERIIRRGRNFPPNIYFNIPFMTMVKYDVKRDTKLHCTLKKATDSKGNLISTVDREIVCNVAKRDGRFYLPIDLVQHFGFTGVEYYEFILQKVVRPDGSQQEIYPNEMVEKNIRPISQKP